MTPSDVAAFMNDPNWAKDVQVIMSRPAAMALPDHSDCSPIDVDSTAYHLQTGGTLGRMDGYEERPGQLDALRGVTRSFNNREHLMIEAGTGVGKSLAYLVPSVQWSFVNTTPVIISTATRNLQSQLILHDLPRAVSTLGDDAPNFKYALLKGRTNYLCLRAMEELMQDGLFSFSAEEQEAFTQVVKWFKNTEDGDLDTLDAESFRSRLCCHTEDCAGKYCPFASKCFVAKSHVRANRAHVIIVNHSLALADAANPNAGILPPYGRIVFDEAHNLEDIATEFFSYELSAQSLAQVIAKLTKKSKGRHRSISRGLLGQIERQLNKGLLAKATNAENIFELVKRAHVQSAFIASAGDELFDVLKNLLSPVPEANILRLRNSDEMGRQYAVKGLFKPYTSIHWDEERLASVFRHFESEMAKLQEVLTKLEYALANATPEGELPLCSDLVAQVKNLNRDFTDYLLESKFVLSASEASHVYWVERVFVSKRKKSKIKIETVRLVAAPLSVANEMNASFYKVKDSVVLCSATLRVRDRFNYMAQKLGVSLVEPERVKALVAASPFDYFRQSLVLAPDFLPDPSLASGNYVRALAPFLHTVFDALGGRGLVLFTAYEMMRAVAKEVAESFNNVGIRLLVQGDGASREQMVRVLKEAVGKGEKVVLFGAQSFWEGVDVPGEALSCVVIARLPFPQVTEPIVEARCDKIKEEGGMPFRDYSLPEALIRFRQGFGRLVRTRSDRGVVIITDPRMVTKNYAGSFRNSIPATIHAVPSMDDLIARTNDFFRPN